MRLAIVLFVSCMACARKEAAPEKAAARPAASTTLAAVHSPVPAPTRAAVSEDTSRACEAICANSRSRHCRNESQCLGNCLAMGSLTPCKDQVSAFYRCLVAQPAQNWECADDGVAAIREGFCDKEQEQAVTCMEAKMQ